MAGTLAIIALVPLLSGSVRLEGSASCPASGVIEAKLALMLPEASGPRHVARVDDAGKTLVLALETEEGVPLARKELPRRGTCDELAQVAAVVIAAWEARFREGALVLPDGTPAAASRPPPAAPEPPGEPAPLTLESPAPPAPPEPSPVSTPPSSPSEPLPSSSSLSLRGEVGAVAGFSARWAFGALVRGSIGREPWSGVALALIETPRTLALGEGSVRWTRPLVGAGARWRAREAGPRLELEGGAAVAWLRLEGTGFAQNTRATDIDPAAWAGATVSWRLGTWRPFVGALGLYWLREQSASVRITTTSEPEELVSRDLPRIEAMAVVGLSFPAD